MVAILLVVVAGKEKIAMAEHAWHAPHTGRLTEVQTRRQQASALPGSEEMQRFVRHAGRVIAARRLGNALTRAASNCHGVHLLD
jgi:hypothetical protein